MDSVMDWLEDLGGAVLDYTVRLLEALLTGSLSQDQTYVLVAVVVVSCAIALTSGILYQRHGERIAYLVPWWIIKGALIVMFVIVVSVARVFGRRWGIPGWLTGASKDPDRELIPIETVDPSRLPGREPLTSNEWPVHGERRRANSIGLTGMPEAAKDQAFISWITYHELIRGTADLFILDAKVEQIRFLIEGGYLPPDVDLYVYGSSPLLEELGIRTDAFDIFDCPRPRTAARILTADKDKHWQGKAADVIIQMAAGIRASGGQGTLAEVADVLADPEAIEEMFRRYPRARVSRNENELGSAISTAQRALDPLEHPRTRALFAGGARMPDHSSEKRQIVFFCPDSSAEEEENITAAFIDVVVQRASLTPESRVQKFLLNEAASFVSLLRLPKYIEITRGYGLYLLYALQSYSQAKRQLGQDGAESLWDSTDLKIVGAGASEEIAKDVSRASGIERVEHRRKGKVSQLPREEQIVEERRAGLLEDHISGLNKGQFATRQGTDVRRFDVPEEHYFFNFLKRLKRNLAGKNAGQ